MAATPDGALLFHPSGSAVQIYDASSGALLRRLLGGHYDTINACLWNEAEGELYSGANDGNIVVWAPPRERVRSEAAAGGRGGGGQDSDADAWSD